MTLRMNVVQIFTQDLPASLAFYRRLGIEIPDGAETEPHVQAELPGGVQITWDPISTIHSFDESWTAPTGSPRMAFAVTCDTPAEVDATYAELIAAGVTGHLEPWDAFWGMRYASVRDPDGNGVDLCAPLPS